MYLGVASRQRRVRAYALGTSAIVLGIMVSGPAAAQCIPASSITCAGTDTDGLTVTTDNTCVLVTADATVLPGAAAAAITTQARDIALQIAGLVDGQAKTGILVTSGLTEFGPCDPYAGASVGTCTPGSYVPYFRPGNAAISVESGGTVTGANGIVFRRASALEGSVSGSINNAGTITGTAGEAILADGDGVDGITIRNSTSGTIGGGIAGRVSYLTNNGRIDGGSRSALATTQSGAGIVNSGTILSRGTAAATLSGTGNLNVTNEAGGTIGGSAVAITTSGRLVLTNMGTINGSVISTAAADQASTIDTREGTINGDLRLGAGNDLLRAQFNPATGQVASITGAIDGGAGTDTLSIGIDTDATLATAVLPTNFELFGLDLTNDPTITIAASFTSGSGLSVSGAGTVINQAALVTRGPAIRSMSIYGQTFVNENSITATFEAAGGAEQFAVSTPQTLRNAGVITAINGGGARAYGAIENSGTITASGTGVLLDFTGSLTNTGAIRSTAGTAVSIGYSGGYDMTNAGDIAGATNGLVMASGRFTNTGTITGGSAGVVLGGTLINSASGTITGGTAGVARDNSAARLVNAGTINGTVDFVPTTAYDSTGDIFVDDGGTVNGAIRLGGGDDELVVSIQADPSRPLAGATGGVDAGAGHDTLRYRVNADADAALTLAGGFEGLAYELADDAKLTLTAASPTVTTIGLTGNGTVTLGGAISTANRSLISTAILSTAQLTGEGDELERELTIVNNGDLTLTTSERFSYSAIAAIFALSSSANSTTDVTNNGTISVTNVPGAYYPATAIFGGATVTNAGTISVTGGGVAIASAQEVINSGTITASGTAATATGVSDFATLTNSGTIRADGVAVQSGYGSRTQVTNSGTIESRLATAIVAGYYGTVTNEAGGTISGATAVQMSGSATLVNRGAFIGNVEAAPYSYGSMIYVADGGTLTGDLLFGTGDDTLVLFGDDTGISGTIDAGEGTNTLILARRESSTITLGAIAVPTFDALGVRALGSDTQVTVRAEAPFVGDLALSGDGAIVNTATITGVVRTGNYYGYDSTIAGLTGAIAFTNEGTIEGGFGGNARSFANTGAITGTVPDNYAVSVWTYDTLAFDNSGTIGVSDAESGSRPVGLIGYSASAIDATNSGTIAGGISIDLQQAYLFPDQQAPITISTASLTNSGTITADGMYAPGVSIRVDASNGVAGSAILDNSGTIEASGAAGDAAYVTMWSDGWEDSTGTIDITNSGVIRANGSGVEQTFDWYGETVRYVDFATALQVNIENSGTATITNSGTIEATGERSVAVLSLNGSVDLTNSGTITGGSGTTNVAGAIQTNGSANDRVINTGTITGSIALGAGDDRIENHGRLDGDVFLGAGDDTFLQRASAILTGTVDGGVGSDSLIVDATGGGRVNGDQFVNFERFSQVGDGNVTYAGTFRFDTIGLSGGTITVAEGQTLESDGLVTITGSDAGETLDNRGTILGTAVLGGGNDIYVDHAGSSVVSVDGGAESDLYRVVLSGDRSGIAQRTGFERLAVEGNGTLTLALDQQFDDLALSGAGVNLTLGGFGIGQVTGSDLGETLTVDGDLAAVDLGGGNDQLALGIAHAAGRYTGGAGNDTLRFTTDGPILLTGTATGFEQLDLTGGSMIVTGTLAGSESGALTFGDGAQQLTLAASGRLVGAIDLGAGDDRLRLVGTLAAGSVSGGAGMDIATVEMAGNRTLAGGTLTDFELLASEGTGTLTLAGTHAYQRVESATDLTLASDATVSAASVQFGARDDRFTLAGRFIGSVDGGAGNDTISVSGGSAAAPVAFGSVNGIERYVQTGGFVTISGVAGLGIADLSGGRLVGLAGSTINAGQFTVAPGATFGSAGTVNGNVTVAGTLSPGASIGTMTVNGNVALAAGSVSLFEIASTSADRLQVNGSLNIAAGATLQLATSGTIRPGVSYDLIVASGGITGSYSNVLKPDNLFGFVIQRADRIQLLGQFLGGAGFTPQVARSINYANATLQVQPATSDLFAALPALLAAGGASDPRAFAQLTPEAYASATQAGVDNALTLASAARGPAFATAREEAGPFTFGQIVGQWHSLGADTDEGTAAARTRGYGFLGGVGYGNADFSVGVFGGYLDSRQTIGALAAQTENDGFVGGVHARYAANGLGLTASLLYDGGEATTTRALPGASRATGRYDLHSWAADLSVSYAIDMDAEWSLRPRAGVTYLRTTRDDVSEDGGAFALQVARDRHVAGFIDGGLTVARSDASTAAFRPFVGLGVRYQIEGRRSDAVAGYAGGPLSLTAYGASRARAVGTVSAGLTYRLTSGLDLFSTASAQTGRDDHQEAITTGVRLRF